jgi:hypothetical protein
MARATHRPSLANVRTLTTRKSSAALQKHELYMKLTSLEIERSRRETERKATVERVAIVDQRLALIEAEQNVIRGLLADAEQVESITLQTPPVKSSSPQNRNGMQFKY